MTAPFRTNLLGQERDDTGQALEDLAALGARITTLEGRWALPVFSTGVELYHPSSAPFIDFHRAASAAGDASADYNVRLVNSAAGILELVGGNLQVPGLEVRTTTGNAGIDFTRTPGTGDYNFRLVNDNANVLNMTAIGGAGTARVHIDGALSVRNEGIIRRPPTLTTAFTEFSHEGRGAAITDYSILSQSDGNTFINCKTGTVVWIRSNNQDRLTIDDNSVVVYRPVTLNEQKIFTRGFNDGNHYIQWLATYDGVEVKSWANTNLYVAAADAHFRLQSDGNAVLYDNGSAWAMKSIPSALATKQEVKALEADALEKVMRLRPVSFKRRYTDRRPELKKELAKVKKQAEPERPVEQVEADLAAAEDRWTKRLDPKVQRPELGFIAEEVEAVDPRLVTPASGDLPMGVTYAQMSALLVGALQQAWAQVEALTARVAALEAKAAVKK